MVNGFNSVGAMLESIYLALHSCLRAVVGVVEAAAKARAQMAHFVSAFAALRQKFPLKYPISNGNFFVVADSSARSTLP